MPLVRITANWLSSNKDLIAMILSVTAILVAYRTIAIARRQSRLDTYARMHESMVSPDAARGRKRLFLHYRHQTSGPGYTFPRPEDDDWDEINQALALYDTLGMYFKARIVPRRLLLRAWHHPLKAIARPAREFAEWRRSMGILQPWNGLDYLLERARRVRCDCGFCKSYGP